MKTLEKRPRSRSTPCPAEVHSLTQALAAPFPDKDVRFKPGAVSGNRALALAYVDARVIQDRLDEVLGVDGWQDDYECLPDGSVVCRLRLRLGDEWVTKVDVGGPSEQPDGGDRLKAAFSDALKRAAVKFGIGRYLYRQPSQWLPFDSQRRQFLQAPSLRGKAPEKSGHPLPASGTELKQRLQDHDAVLAGKGVCAPGELIKHVLDAGVRAGHGDDLTKWSGPAIQLAVQETRAFEAARVSRPRAAS